MRRQSAHNGISTWQVVHYSYLVKDEENIIQRNRRNQVEEEPRLQVVLRDDFRIQYHLLRIVLLHYPWTDEIEDESRVGR